MKMVSQNSLVPNVLGFLHAFFRDLIISHKEARKELERDLLTIVKRTQSEGLSFLTKVLPTFGKAFDLGLQGHSFNPPNFKRRGGVLPVFLRGLTRKVFTDQGQIRSDFDIVAVNDVRQLCYMFYKLELPYDQATVKGKIETFKEVDISLPLCCSSLSEEQSRILTVARALVTSLFEGINPLDIKPGHGPGAVAEGYASWEKMYFTSIPIDAERFYPLEEYFFPRDSMEYPLRDLREYFFNIDKVEEAYSVLDTVPKDSRGPRLIGKEPLALMWLQQGLKRLMYNWIEKHPLTKGHVNFTNQNINRRLALEGSLSGYWSTIDLDSASDRVSLCLVRELFANLPDLLAALISTRSAGTLLPDGNKLKFRKFAPMGSAICFPIEAVCFWSLTAAALHILGGVPLRLAVSSTYVYGDDIIIPTQHFSCVESAFPAFGLKLSESKCCVTGFFRESCGCDAFFGEDVTPVKVKRYPLKFPHMTVPEQLSLVALRNNLYRKGYFETCRWLDDQMLEKLGPLPVIPLSCGMEVGYFHKIAFKGTPFYPKKARRRFNKSLQLYEVMVKSAAPLTISVCGRYAWMEVLQSLLRDDVSEVPQWEYDVRYRLTPSWSFVTDLGRAPYVVRQQRFLNEFSTLPITRFW